MVHHLWHTSVMKSLWWFIVNCGRRGPVVRFIYDVLQLIGSSSISIYARFASRPCFPHGIKGIFISGGTDIGRDCVIFHQVTIGSNTLIDSKSAGSPIIGDNCYLGAGAKIIGRVKIGDNVRVGANAVVYSDIPNDSVVVSDNSVITQKPGMDNRYYTFSGKWRCHENGDFVDVTDSRLEQLEKIFR